jgi:hypothetical protein
LEFTTGGLPANADQVLLKCSQWYLILALEWTASGMISPPLALDPLKVLRR